VARHWRKKVKDKKRKQTPIWFEAFVVVSITLLLSVFICFLCIAIAYLKFRFIYPNNTSPMEIYFTIGGMSALIGIWMGILLSNKTKILKRFGKKVVEDKVVPA
jgi:hypothetical protein